MGWSLTTTGRHEPLLEHTEFCLHPKFPFFRGKKNDTFTSSTLELSVGKFVLNTPYMSHYSGTRTHRLSFLFRRKKSRVRKGKLRHRFLHSFQVEDFLSQTGKQKSILLVSNLGAVEGQNIDSIPTTTWPVLNVQAGNFTKIFVFLLLTFFMSHFPGVVSCIRYVYRPQHINRLFKVNVFLSFGKILT